MPAPSWKLDPSDAPRCRRFMTDNRLKPDKFMPVLQSRFSGWTQLLRSRMLVLMPRLKIWKSRPAELLGCFRDSRLQLAFTFQSRYPGMARSSRWRNAEPTGPHRKPRRIETELVPTRRFEH